MAQLRNDPIELYEGAAQYMRGIIAEVKPEQFADPTPCTKWNVQELINHNIKVHQGFLARMTGSERVNPFEVSGPLPPEGAVAAFASSTGAVLDAIKTPGMVDKVVEGNLGPLPCGQLIMFPFTDLLIHKWDLAQATGQDSTLDSAMIDACYALIAPLMDRMRSGGNFATGVSLPVTASAQDRLLGITGRQP